MKIGIDTFGCDSGRSGLGSYLASLVSVLPETDSDNGKLEWELFGPEIDRYTYTGDRGFPFVAVNVPDSLNLERLWHLFRGNPFAAKKHYDVVLYTAGIRMLPQKFKVKGIAVINDIVSSYLEQDDSPFYRKKILKSLSRINHIIAASNFIKDDLINKCGVDSSRIDVVYNGVDHSKFYAGGVELGEAVDIKPFAIKRPYLIYPSRMQGENKKHIELIESFSLFKKTTNLPHRLVIAGSEGSTADEIRAAAKNSPYANDIFITGFFPHENFPDLYRNADACIFPSVTEGVGLSVIEAMACGLPVACSAEGALKEIAGEGALYFYSSDVKEIADSIEKIVTDNNLRTKLINSGIEKAKEYSWKKTAEQTVRIIRSVCGC